MASTQVNLSANPDEMQSFTGYMPLLRATSAFRPGTKC